VEKSEVAWHNFVLDDHGEICFGTEIECGVEHIDSDQMLLRR